MHFISYRKYVVLPSATLSPEGLEGLSYYNLLGNKQHNLC